MVKVSSELLNYFESTGARPIIVASHPRSGTHLLLDTLRRNFPECQSYKWPGETRHHLYFNLDTLEELDSRTALRMAARIPRPVFKTHALADFDLTCLDPRTGVFDPELIAWLKQHATFFYTYRDGRETLCSLHELSKAVSGPHTDFSRFIREAEHQVSRPALWARHLDGWFAKPGVYCVSMEELLRFPERVLPGIAERLGCDAPEEGWALPVPPRSHLQQRISRLVSTCPESTGIFMFNRPPHESGKSTWPDAFDAADRQFFAEQTGNALIRFGYEDSDAWIDPANDVMQGRPAGFWASAFPPAGDRASHGIPKWMMALLIWAFAIALVLIDLKSSWSVPILYGIPVLIAARTFSRRGAWVLAGLLVSLTLTGLAVKVHSHQINDASLSFRYMNRTFAIIGVLLLTWLLQNVVESRDSQFSRRPRSIIAPSITLPIAGVMLALICAIDFLTPSEVNPAMLYSIPLLLISRSGDRKLVFGGAIATGLLVVAGYLIPGPQSGMRHEWLYNRVLDIAILACVTVFSLINIRGTNKPPPPSKIEKRLAPRDNGARKSQPIPLF